MFLALIGAAILVTGIVIGATVVIIAFIDSTKF